MSNQQQPGMALSEAGMAGRMTSPVPSSGPPGDIGSDPLFTLIQAAEILGQDPEAFQLWLFRSRIIYRYTGIGRPLAYVRWVRAGLLVNTPSNVMVTRTGLDHLAMLLDQP